MKCINTNDCPCPKTECPQHKKCCDCIAKHNKADSLVYCIFPESDKSLENFYKTLKKRFEG